MRLTSKQIQRNIEIEKDLKAKKICCACGMPFSKVKRSKALQDTCEICEKDFD